MRFTKFPVNTFNEIVLNAGIITTDFNPTTGTYEETDLLGATSGGIQATATPTYVDMGDGIDNCPANVMELKKVDSWECKVSGTLLTMTTAMTQKIMAAATVSGEKVTPSLDLPSTAFGDIWVVCDYGSKNGETKGGFVAIHLINALSTGGFSLQSADNGKGTFSFEFTGHFSIEDQTTVPFEVYIHEGANETA